MGKKHKVKIVHEKKGPHFIHFNSQINIAEYLKNDDEQYGHKVMKKSPAGLKIVSQNVASLGLPET